MDFFLWDNLNEISTPKGIPKSVTRKAAILSSSYLIIQDKSIQNIKKKTGTLTQILWSSPISQISCNRSLVLFTTSSGEIWGLGSDDSQSGLLCSENLYKSEVPVKIDCFSQPIAKVSLGPTHAACISESGSLFTWGSGESGELGDLSKKSSKPQLVSNASFFRSSEVSCGSKLTAVCTEAGLLFVFGKKNNCGVCKKSSLYPITLKSLSDDFITKVFSSADDLVVHNEKGEIKIINKCFCIQNFGNKGRISNFAGFEGGFVGLSADRRFFFVFRREKKTWTCENVLLSTGEVAELVSSPDLEIGIIGKGVSAKGMKKVSGVASGNTENGRVSFEEIVQGLGLKKKSAVGPGEIVNIISKMILFLLSDVFSSLKRCPKRKMNSLMTLSNRFVSISIEKYWRTWTSFSSGYKRASFEFQVKSSKFKSRVLSKTLAGLWTRQLRSSFAIIFTQLSLKENKSKYLKPSLHIFSKFFLLALSRNFHKFNRSCLTYFKKNNFVIDPNYNIEIFKSNQSNFNKSSSPVTARSCMSDSDVTTEKPGSSTNESLKSQTVGLSNSVNLSSSILDFFSQSPPDSSPKISASKNQKILSGQTSKKIGEKVSPNIKISSKTGENLLKGPARGVDRKKHFTAKEPEVPKLFTKKSLESKVLKRQTAGAVDKIRVSQINNKRAQNILIRVVKKKFLAIIGNIKIFKIETKKNNWVDSGNAGSLSPRSLAQGNWKIKLYGLGLNKLGKILASLVAKQVSVGLRCVKRLAMEN